MLGGRHFVTFDRRRFSLPAPCAHTLLEVRGHGGQRGVAAGVAGRWPLWPWWQGSARGCHRVTCHPQDFVAGRLLITAEHEPCDSHRPPGCPRSLTVTTSRTTARLHGTGDTPGQDCHHPRTLVAIWQLCQCLSPVSLCQRISSLCPSSVSPQWW